MNLILLFWPHVSVKSGRDIYLCAEQSKTVFSAGSGWQLPAPSGVFPMHSSGLSELGGDTGTKLQQPAGAGCTATWICTSPAGKEACPVYQADSKAEAGPLRHPLPRTSLMQKNTSLLPVNDCISASIVGSCHQSSKIMDSEEWPKLHPPNKEMGLSKVSYWVRVRLAGLVGGINTCILCLSWNLGKAWPGESPTALRPLPDHEASSSTFRIECCPLCTVPVITNERPLLLSQVPTKLMVQGALEMWAMILQRAA